MIEAGLKRRRDLSILHRRLSSGKDTARHCRETARRGDEGVGAPGVQERLVEIGVEPMPMTVAEFGEFFKKDIAANLELVKAAKIERQ